MNAQSSLTFIVLHGAQKKISEKLFDRFAQSGILRRFLLLRSKDFIAVTVIEYG
jgi:hypothetical protein